MCNMLYILVEKISPRLSYTLNWIFKEQLGISYTCVSSINDIPDQNAAVIAYGKNNEHQFPLFIKANDLLFQQNFEEQTIHYHRWKHTSIIFYNQPGAKIPFDLFGAVFFCISRYEEYTNPKRDKHNRFESKSSIAAQYNFLKEPVVDLWLLALGKILQVQFGITAQQRNFTFIPSFDIDIAYNYAEKPLWKNVLGATKDALKGQLKLVRQRQKVISGNAQDPYDNFDWLQQIHAQYQFTPLYFWLLAQQPKGFDTNNNSNSPRMQALLLNHKDKVINGIHPSYSSNNSHAILMEEIAILKKFNPAVNHSRQHYIKLNLPETYHKLIAAQVYNDYTMGYADSNGFRAGTSNSFYWYNFQEEKVTPLRIHPFVFMDASAIFYDKLKPSEALLELEQLYWAIKKTQSQMIVIFHNYTMGLEGNYVGWRTMYQQVLDLATNNFEPNIIL